MKAKTIIILLTIALLIALVPAGALAVTEYSYIDESGTTQTTGALTVTPIVANTATLSNGWYVVNDDVLRSGTITVSGDAKLILVDGKTLTVTAASGSKNAGIYVVGANSLTIFGQAGGTGVLNATGDAYGAGIGSKSDDTTGTITINGGTVNAYGGDSCAGIGSGSYGNGGTITINGGVVNSTGGNNGPGIGSGWQNVDGGTITINGGTVNAQGVSYGAGIGSGYFGDGGTITINKGTVDATGGYYGAGIGGGEKGDGGNITINGGTIKATGGSYGAGIGGGSGGEGGKIIITSGIVTAAGSGNTDWGGAGIGGGFNKGGGNITIRGGVVTATGRKCGAGIGGSGGGSAGIITISGGIVTAEGDDYVNSGSPGIGNGAFGEGGTITLSGGVVFAKAGPKANDIGKGGASNSFDSLEISNTAAVFLKTNSCVIPTTTTHTHNTISGHFANASVYGIAVPWSGNFGAYLRLNTLSYNANNGSGTPPAQVTQHIGTSVSVAGRGILNRTGYTFSGWNTAANKEGSGYNVGGTFTFLGDTTLYAVWTPYTYTISYNAYGGTGSTASSNHTYDEAKPLTSNGFTKKGYTFVGWATGAGGAVAYSNGQSVTNLTIFNRATVTLYAVWRPNSYTVSYDANGGTGSTDSSNHTYDEIKTLTACSFIRTGYTFAGWATEAGGTVVKSNAQSVLNLTTEDNTTVMLYAVWAVNSYTVRYDANGGLGSTDSSSHTYDEAKTLTASRFTRTGYTFAGWATEAGGAVAYTDKEQVLNLTPEDGGTVTLYAVWTPYIYTVIYNANGGMGATLPSSHHYDEARALTSNGFTNKGYCFAGWATSAVGPVVYLNGQNVMNLTAIDKDTVELFVVWVKDDDLTSGSSGNVVNCTSGVNVRSGPGTNYSILGVAPKGAKYDITGQIGEWFRVNFMGTEGYISARYFEQASQENSPITGQGTIVNCNVSVNIRSGPGTRYSILGLAPKGASYTITGQSGAWYKIDFGGKVGYISADYFSASEVLPASPAESGQGTIVNCNHSVNVRSGPGTEYPILGFAPKGAVYTITGKSGAWYQIDFSGTTAYISARYFSAGND